MTQKARKGKEGPIPSGPIGSSLPEYMPLNDVVKYVMKANGWTRRQAEQHVLRALKSGEVRARGVAVGAEDLGPQTIPVEVFQDIPSEH